jgi:hypothetical protein
MKYDEQRKFIHDMANTITIVEASVSRVLSLLSRNHPELEEEISRLKKADEYSKKCITSIKEFREMLHSQMKVENN